MQSSYCKERPSSQYKVPDVARDAEYPVSTSIPRSRNTFMAIARAPTVCCGKSPLRVTNDILSLVVLEIFASSFVKRACMDIANSKPPAPPPTINKRLSSLQLPILFKSPSQRAPKPSIGLTGVTLFAVKSSCTLGAEPVLIDSTSYAIGGLSPLSKTCLFSRSRPTTVACTNRTRAKRASILRSKWHSRLVYKPATCPGIMPL
mmetsp:Transcript_114207/g.179794  ORF Transcript_114207/g.179794 Transcript_114207/m.179794 type:complete len:204 (-) Transcript_114207:570-1181(-)